jgi:hypothetical protein
MTEPSNWLLGPGADGFIREYLDLLPAPAIKVSPFSGVRQKVYIAMTSRTGSTVLANDLIQYGLVIGEYFSLNHVARAKAQHGVNDYGELCAAYAAENAPNNLFGVKGTLQMMVPLFLAGEFPMTLRDWKFVYLTRDNLVRQAISLVVAQKTNAWESKDRPVRELTDEDYSAAEIAHQMRSILQGQLWLEFFFSAFQVQPLRLKYEEFVADRAGAVEKVAKFCELRKFESFGRRRRGEPPEAQSTDLNIEWERRFRREATTAAL